MDSPMFSKYSWLDFLFSVVGVCTYLFDVGSDIWVATEFYSRGDFFWFGVLIGLMVLSSVVVQMFSWFWFKYDRELEGFDEQTAKNILFGGCVKLSFLLHVLQLGFFCRHISAIWQGFNVWWRQEQGSGYAVYLTHDLSMLRLIETFCESAPQLTLMTHIMLHTNKARTVQCVSVVASTTSIAWMVVDYHRSLRSFLPDKAKQGWGSALVYFLWNLLLIAPRVAAVALFATILPSYLAAHFLLIWPVLVFWVWRQETDFMDSAGGEWLYRATVGLIWYFSWFSIVEGHTRQRSTIYHTWIGVDIGMLCGVWVWQMKKNPPYFELPLDPYVILGIMISFYIVGLGLKVIYYKYSHPKITQLREDERCLEPEPRSEPEDLTSDSHDEVDCRLMSHRMGPTEPVKTLSDPPDPVIRVNKRMRNLADNFYS